MRSRWVAASSTILSALLLAGCGSSHARHVTITVTPRSSLEDQPIDIRVDGLRPKQGVYVTLSSRDAKGVAFTARAAYAADGRGRVDLANAAPLKGSSYSGVWQMGLLTSMSAPNAAPRTVYWWKGDHPMRFQLSVASAGRSIAAATFTRRFTRNRLQIVEATVAKDGFLGTFYAPRGSVHRPAVLAFGGSEGGTGSVWEGEQLAADGIPTLEIGYFHAPTLPDRLVNIPLEYFRTALRWLEHRREVDPGRTSVMSGSYGTEAALLLGVHYPALVHRVVALTPSNVVTCGIAGAHRPLGCLGSAWTFAGKPLPYTKLLNNPAPWDDPRAVIPVQRIEVPVFLSCGGRDEVWSSCAYAHAIVRRRRGETTVLRSYPDAGHYSNGAFFEYEPGTLANDFYVPADERAREDLTPRVLRFLRFET